jgi:hypothetical protein
MPKQPVQQRFRISCEVDVADLGPAMVALAHIAGLTVTGSELVTDVATFKSRPKQTHDVKAEDYLIDWIADHPEFKAKEAVEHFREAGRTDGACYTALRVLCERKLLRKLGEGRYSRLDAKHQPKKKNPTPVRRDVSHPAFLLRLASRNHSRFNTAWAKTQFEKDKRSPGNVSPTIAKLMKDKQIKRVSESEYVLLQKAAKSKPGRKTPKAKTNGAAIEGAANG